MSGLREVVAASTRVVLDSARFPRTFDAYEQLQKATKEAIRNGQAMVFVKNGLSLGVIFRSLVDQIRIRGYVMGVAFAFSIESGRGALCVPLTNEHTDLGAENWYA